MIITGPKKHLLHLLLPCLYCSNIKQKNNKTQCRDLQPWALAAIAIGANNMEKKGGSRLSYRARFPDGVKFTPQCLPWST